MKSKLLSTIFNKVNSLLRKSTLRTRLLFTFFLVTFLPLAAVSLFSYFTSSQTNLNTLKTYSASTVAQISAALNHTLTYLEDITVKVSYLPSVQNAFYQYTDISPDKKEDLLKDLNETITSEFILMNDIRCVSLYLNRSEQFLNAYGNLESEKEFLENNFEKIAEKIRLAGGSTVYTAFSIPQGEEGTNSTSQNYIVMCRPVYDKNTKEMWLHI